MSKATAKITDQLNAGLVSGLEFGQARWRLLAKQGNNKVCLLTEDIVDNAPYDRSKGERCVKWEYSYLREYMNNVLPAILFTEAEYACVEPTRTSATMNPLYVTWDDGAVDKLFPLSIEEVDRCLGDGNTLNTIGKSYLIVDDYNQNRIAKKPGTAIDWWWLRTPGKVEDLHEIPWMPSVLYQQCYIGNKGSINVSGSNYDDAFGGIRPAIWLAL